MMVPISYAFFACRSWRVAAVMTSGLALGCEARLEIETDHPLFPWDEGTGTAPSSDGETGPASPSSSSTQSESSSSDSTETDSPEPAWAWSPETTIGSTNGDVDALYPKVTIDAHGNTLVAWQEIGYNPTTYGVGTNFYSPQLGWGSDFPLVTYAEGFAGQVKLCGNSAGSAVAAWPSSSTSSPVTLTPSPRSVSLAYYTPTEGWLGPIELHASTSFIASVECGIDSDGNALLVWAEQGEPAVLQFSRGRGDVWTSPQVIAEEPDLGGLPVLTMNEAGNAFLAWPYGSYRALAIAGQWYDPNDGWGETLRRAMEPLDLRSLAITLGGDNTAHVAWFEARVDYTELGQLWSSPFTYEEGWGDAVRIDDSEETAGDVALGADDSGAVLAVWNSYTPYYGEGRVRSRRYTPSGGWEPIRYLADHGFMVSVSVSPGGKGLAAFRNTEAQDARGAIETVYFAPDGSIERFVTEPSVVDARVPQVGINDAGQAVVVWAHSDLEGTHASAIVRR